MKTKRGTGALRGAWIAAGLLLAASACHLPGPGAGESYTPQGDPWAARKSEAGDGAGAAAAKGDGAKKPDATAASAKEPGPADGQTVLEQLEQARARVKALEGENQKMRDDAAALTALVEQLKHENQNLAQLADASAQSRASLDQEMEKQRQKMKEFETRCLALADDLLSERIQRVRVERELILAKVKDAEKQDDGH